MSGSENPLSGSDSSYLQEKLGLVLVEGLAEICECQPRDPIEYLARWLIHKARLEQIEAEEAKRLEELQRELEAADAEREYQAKRWLEQKRIMEEEARKRREAEAEKRRKQQHIDAMRRRSEKEWRQDLMQFADLTTQVLTVEGARSIVTKANPDFGSKTDDEVIEECDVNKDGVISFEDLKTYLKENLNISVAPWEAGHVPSLQRLPEEDESSDGSRDVKGRTELHRLAISNASNVTELIEKLVAEDNFGLMDRDNEGLAPRELAQNEGLQENVQTIDRLVLKWVYDGVVNGQTTMLDNLILGGFSGLPNSETLTEADLFTPEQIEQFVAYTEEVQGKRTEFFEAISDNNVAKIEELLNSDRQLLSARDERGMGAFHIAVSDKKPEIVKFLRKTYTSAMNTRDSFGRTAMNLAQSIEDESEKDTITKLLTEQGVTFSEDTPAVQESVEGEGVEGGEQPITEQADEPQEQEPEQ